MATNNAINLKTAGIVVYDGAGVFSADTTTNHDVLIGAASNGITNVAPSATSGIPLVSNGASADPSFTTAVVGGGGTGNTTFTAYAVIAAGTTATGAFQNVSGVGTSGQVLTSNGAAALPTWQTPGVGSVTTVTGTLTSAQIKALHATPIQIVAAQGSGKTIQIIYATYKFNYGGTNVFVAGAAQVIAPAWGTVAVGSAAVSNAVLVGTTTQLNLLTGGNASVQLYSRFDNTALNFYNSVATEITGNAANDNTMTYSLTYQVVTI